MARYPSPGIRGYSARRKVKWRRYVITFLLIGGAVFILYRSLGRGEAESDGPSAREAVAEQQRMVEPVVIPEKVGTSGGTAEAAQAQAGEMSEAPAPAVEEVVVEESRTEPNAVEVPSLVTAEPPPVSMAAEAPSGAERLIAEAVKCMDAGPAKLIEAREKFNKALRGRLSGEQRAFVKKQMSVLAEAWLFSREILAADELCSTYKVRSGDQLAKIGREYKVPYELLAGINHIDRPELLRAGESIKVVHGPFHAKVYRSQFRMDVYLQDRFVRSFSVGLGKPGMETPTGMWRVKTGGKLIEPPWPDPVTGKVLYPGDPGYALGSRWIALEGISGEAKGRTGFGIHGTKDPESIGRASSRGCIRLYNGEVKLLYNLLVAGDSQVEVVD